MKKVLFGLFYRENTEGVLNEKPSVEINLRKVFFAFNLRDILNFPKISS